jgi:hypothetical protein
MASQVVGLGVSFGLNSLGRALSPSQKVFNRQEVGRSDNNAVRKTGQGWSLDRVYGKYKVTGCPIFWAIDKVNVQETSTSSETTGGKGGGGGQTTVTETVTNKKFGTFAFAICDGPIAEIRRIEFNDIIVYNSAAESAGGVEASTFMLNSYLEIYLGTETQSASPTISTYSDPERVKFPFLCYVVVKDYPLEQLGDELPGTINVVVYGTKDNVNTVLLDIGSACGVTPIAGTIGTLLLSGRLKQDGSSAKSFIEEAIQRYFLVSYLDDNGIINFAKQENTDTPIDIDYEDLGVISFNDNPSEPFTENILDSQDLPSQVTLNYIHTNDSFNGGSATWIKPSASHFRAESLSTSLAMTADEASQFCWRYMRKVWDEDRDFSFRLLPENAPNIRVRDKINVPLIPGSNPVTLQVTEIQTGADFSLEIKAIPYQGETFSTTPSVPKYTQVTVTGSTIQLSPNLTAQPVISDGITVYTEGIDYTVDLVTGEITLITIPSDTVLNIDYESEPDLTENDTDPNGELPFFGEPIVTILDIPRVNNSDPPSLYLAIEPDPSYGIVGTTDLYARIDGSSYVKIGRAQSATTTGVLDSALPLATGLDTVNTVSIVLDRGFIDPLTLTQFNNNEFILLINDEHIVAKDVVLTAPLTYDVSYLKRGHNGTLASSHAIGDKVTVLNGNGKVIGINGDATNIGKTLDVKAIPLGQSLSTITAVYSQVIEGLYFKPYAGSSATATKNQIGKITINWTANNTGLNPLNPYSFEVDILSGLTVVRTISSGSPSVVYSVEDQVTDFGSTQSSLDVKIYQVSIEYGRGYEYSASLTPTLTNDPPVITGFSPTQGDIGDAITIYGSGFTTAIEAQINSVPIDSFVVNSDNSITGVIDTSTTTGKITVSDGVNVAESLTDFVIVPFDIEKIRFYL